LIAGPNLTISDGYVLNISGNTQIRGDLSMNGRLTVFSTVQASTLLVNTATRITATNTLEVSGNAYVYGNIFAGRALTGGKQLTYDTVPINISGATTITLNGATDTGTYYILNGSGGSAQTVILPTTGTIPNGYFYVFRNINTSSSSPNVIITPKANIIDSGAIAPAPLGSDITLDQGSTATFIAAILTAGTVTWIRM
jgi:hypothetical protein